MITRVSRRDFPAGFRCARSFRIGDRLALCGESPEYAVEYRAGHTLYLCPACKDEAVLQGLAAA